MGESDLFMSNEAKLEGKKGVRSLISKILIKVLKYDSIQEGAIRALSKIGEPAVEPLIQILKDENNNSNVRWGAAEALGRIGDKRAVGPLIQALKKNEDYVVRGRAARALGRIGDKRAVEPLIHVLKDENWYVRAGAAYALGKIKDARAVEPLIQALKDKDSDVREGAVEALGEIKDARVIEPLIQALKDYWHVRKKAADALGKIGEPAVEALIQALKDENRDYNIRGLAASALGEIGNERAIEPLFQALDNYHLRYEATESIGKIIVNQLKLCDPDSSCSFRRFKRNEPITIRGKCLVWDRSNSSLSHLYWELPSGLQLSSCDSKEDITIFLLDFISYEEEGIYTDGVPAYSGDTDVYVIYWPEKKAGSVHRFGAGAPPSKPAGSWSPDVGVYIRAQIADWLKELSKQYK